MNFLCFQSVLLIQVNLFEVMILIILVSSTNVNLINFQEAFSHFCSLRAKYYSEHWNVRREKAADVKPGFFFALSVVTCHLHRTVAVR